MTTILRQILNGLQSGSIYALIALGYSMVYGIIMLLNFAHGDIIMVGAYMAWLCMVRFALSPVLAVIVAVVSCTVLGMLIEKAAYTPLRSSPRLSLLITAIGVSYFLENVAQLIFGADSKTVPAFFSASNIKVGDLIISSNAVVTIAVTAVSMILLTLLVQKTKMGKAMRAVSEDMGAAQLMGISINRTISFTFAVGSALAGIGSGALLHRLSQATLPMGPCLALRPLSPPCWRIGSIPGAMIGGLVIGLAESLVSVPVFPPGRTG
jgi:branched-chain amino acid transport system permease protein